MNNELLKVMYIQFCGRVVTVDGKDKHIVAAALYSDKELTNIKALEVCEMTNFEENKQDKYDVYRNRLAEYATALKLAYRYQDSLLREDYNCIVLCPSNTKLWSWLHGNRVPSQVRDLFDNINKQYRLDGQYELNISIGLSTYVTDKKAYKYCKPEYIGARLTKVKRGIHIMTAAEVEAEDARRRAAREAEQARRNAELEEDGVSIYDILQPNQEDELQPEIVFENNDN